MLSNTRHKEKPFSQLKPQFCCRIGMPIAVDWLVQFRALMFILGTVYQDYLEVSENSFSQAAELLF